MRRYGKPEIFNMDQGSQSTSAGFVDVLKDAQVRVSMDGRGRFLDNIFIERLWRSLKHDAIHLHELASGLEAASADGWLSAMTGGRTRRSVAGPVPKPTAG